MLKLLRLLGNALSLSCLLAGLPSGLRAQTPGFQIVNGSTLSIYTTSHLQETGSLGFPGPVSFFAVTPDDSTVYLTDVCCDGGAFTTAEGSITNRVLTNTSFADVNGGPLVVSPDGSRVYVANGTNTIISVYDVASGNLIEAIDIGLPSGNGFTYTAAMQISADGTKLVAEVIPGDGCGAACDAKPIRSFLAVVNTASKTVISRFFNNGLFDLVIAPDASRAYYLFYSTSISVIDLTTGADLPAIPIAATALAISSDGSELYAGESNISVVSTVDNTITGQISLDQAAYITGLAVDSPRQFGVVTYSGAQQITRLATLDLASQTVSNVVPVAGQTDGVALSRDGSQAYVAFTSPLLISVIDASTQTISGAIQSLPTPAALAVSKNDNRLYAALGQLGIMAADAKTLERIKSAPIPGRLAVSLAASANGTTVAIGTTTLAEPFTENIEILHTATFTIDSVLAISDYSFLLISPDGKTLFTVKEGQHYLTSSVSKIDVATQKVLGTATIPAAAQSAVISSAGDRIYVGAGANGQSIGVISTATMQLTATLPYCGELIAVSPDDSTLYTSGCPYKAAMPNSVYVIDVASGTLTNTYSLNWEALTLSISPDGGTLYLAGFNSSQPTPYGALAFNLVTQQSQVIPTYSYYPIVFPQP